MDLQLIAQAIFLLSFFARKVGVAVFLLNFYLVRSVFWSVVARFGLLRRRLLSGPVSNVKFYSGVVTHVRHKPLRHSFQYAVRTACIYLDNPPSWFSNQGKDHMTGEQARKYAGTKGAVWLLTNPEAAGYMMNPISVYYCYNEEGQLDKCIAEVTNTPWNERVTFVVPAGRSPWINKALHVSPLMDMQGQWQIEATAPDDKLKLVVKVRHPKHGNFFYADLVAKRCDGPFASRRNEDADLGTFFRYGLLPHRIAFWIYSQAALLLYKGLPLYSPPDRSVLDAAGAGPGAGQPVNQVSMCPFTWRRAPEGWPWDTWGNKFVDNK